MNFKITSKKEHNKRMEKLFEAIDESIKYENLTVT